MALLSIAQKHDVVVVTFNENRILDENTIRQIGQEFSKLPTEAAAGRKLLLKFDKVTFMTSAMLGQIMKLTKLAKAEKVDLKLCEIPALILDVFKLTRLDKVLDIYKSEAAALQAFGPPHKS